MVYWGDAKHEQASSLSHERGWPAHTTTTPKHQTSSLEANRLGDADPLGQVVAVVVGQPVRVLHAR